MGVSRTAHFLLESTSVRNASGWSGVVSAAPPQAPTEGILVRHLPVSKNAAVITAVLVALLLGSLISVSARAAAADCSVFTTPIYQVAKPEGTSLLTRNPNEVISAQTKYGFTEAWPSVGRVSRSAAAGLTVVYRMYSQPRADFMFAAEAAVAEAQQAGYAVEQVAFYAAAEASTCTVPAFQMTKGGKHRVAFGTSERASAESAGWAAVEVAFYLPTTPVDAPGDAPSSPTTQVPTSTSTTTNTAAPTTSTSTQPPASASPSVTSTGATSTSTTVAPTTPVDPVPPAPVSPQDPSAFTVAVIPDTQMEMTNASDDRFVNRWTWLVANQSALNVRFVAHVGDVTNWGNAAPAQFQKAKDSVSVLTGKIPWMAVAGNHDTAVVCSGGSGCPGVSGRVAVRDASTFNSYLAGTMDHVAGTRVAGQMENALHTFTAGGAKWLVLGIELWPRTEVVTWARDVVASHPDYNVIVVTHSYLTSGGAIATTAEGYGNNPASVIFEQVVKPFENVKMVFSGHDGTATTRRDLGTHGNVILSMLQCYHSTVTNPMRLVTIDVAAGTVKSWVYAPKTNQTLAAAQTWTGLSFIK